MSQKFTFIIEVDNKGKPVGHAYIRSEAAQAVADFNKLREKGVEAYLFQFPVADKKSKSAAQIAATTAYTAQPSDEDRKATEEAAKQAAKAAADEAEAKAQEAAISNMKKRKNAIGGI